MQCAAVISRSWPGLSTTLAVQKWSPLASCSNSAPTRSAVTAVCASGVVPGCGIFWPTPNGRAPSSAERFQ